MVKVSIRDYMPPYTTWVHVELEDELCGSARFDNEENGIEDHGFGTNTKEVDGVNGVIDYDVNATHWEPLN